MTTITQPSDESSYITCKDVDGLLMAYIDDELTPRDRAEFDRHLRVCRSCVNSVDAYKRTIQLSKWATRGALAGVVSGASDQDDHAALPPASISTILKSRRRLA